MANILDFTDMRNLDDEIKPIDLLHKLAEQGNAEAQENLAFRYSVGSSVPRSEEQAVYWYRKAAKQGNLEAQFNLANSYADDKDGNTALYWFEKALENIEKMSEIEYENLPEDIKLSKEIADDLKSEGYSASLAKLD